jgi:prepilin-type N-terminal cleavage/methylation domain-containing protein
VGGRGFTLVELIVVIVILAILAAIAIPALTGYIAKAQDREYEMKAHDAEVAVKSVLNTLYAEGKLGKGFGAEQGSKINDGTATNTPGRKYFDIGVFSFKDTGDAFAYNNMAADLIGWESRSAYTEPGSWYIAFHAPDSPSYTLLDAPAFQFIYYPEGYVSHTTTPVKPVVRVYHGVTGVTFGSNGEFDLSNLSFDDPNANTVFHYTTSTQW